MKKHNGINIVIILMVAFSILGCTATPAQAPTEAAMATNTAMPTQTATNTRVSVTAATQSTFTPHKCFVTAVDGAPYKFVGCIKLHVPASCQVLAGDGGSFEINNQVPAGSYTGDYSIQNNKLVLTLKDTKEPYSEYKLFLDDLVTCTAS